MSETVVFIVIPTRSRPGPCEGHSKLLMGGHVVNVLFLIASPDT